MVWYRRLSGVWAGAVCFACGLAVAQAPVAPGPLWDQATVYRDEWGVPHIFAQNAGAMAYAFGYAQAEDHLSAMLLAYRYANGRAAEVLGEAAAASDAFAIKMGHGDLARASYANADAYTMALCDGFALGVNTWILEHPGVAPEWAEGVTAPDILALMHAYLMSHAPFDVADEFHPAPGTPSANAWAAGPKATESGAAILVMNPHEDYAGPFQWYEAHLVTPEFNLEGATLFGLPMLLMGHNAHLGWALAPNYADIADVYTDPLPRIERNPKAVNEPNFDLETALLLLAAEQTRPFYVRTANGFETRSVQQVVTGQGAMLGRMQGQFLRYRVGGYGEFGALRQLYDMACATTLERFQEALMLHQLPCFHVVYADRDGNVFYLYNAKVGQKFDLDPAANALNSTDGVRVARSVWDGPVSGQDTSFAWGAVVPPPYLPSLLNPASGYVQACGTPPWLATADTGTTAKDWPRWFARDRDSYRAKRVRQLLDGGERSFEDHQAMLYDLLAPFAADAVPYLLDVAKKYPDFVNRAHPDLRAALDMLRDWNYLADTKSMAMTYFHVWWTAFQAYAPGRYSPDELYALLRQDSPDIQRHALQSAEEAAKMLRNEFQTLSVPWGDVHVLRRGAREAPMPGAISGEPLFLASEASFVDKTFPVRVGPGFAMVVRFGNDIDAVSFVPFGASEDPASPHYDDQLDLMTERRFKYTRFAEDDVFRNSTSAYGNWASLHTVDGAGEFHLHTAAPATMSLRVTDDLDVPPPLGAAPFSVFAEPVVTPRTTAIEMEIAFSIDGAICETQHLAGLKLYGYDPVRGWAPVANQSLNAEQRTITAQTMDSRVYAVLGSAQNRLAAPSLERRARPKLAVPKPEGYHPLSVRREHEGDVAKAAPHAPEFPSDPAVAGDTTPARETDTVRVAKNFDQNFLEKREPVTELPMAESPIDAFTPAPAVTPPPRTARDVARDAARKASGGKPFFFKDLRKAEPTEAKPTQVAAADLLAPMEPAPLPFAPRDDAPALDAAASDAATSPDDEPDVAVTVDDAAAVEATAIAPPPPAPKPAAETEPDRPSPKGKTRVSWSMKPLNELIDRPNKAEPQGLYLAPENSISSPIRVGTNIQVAPPVEGALFHLTMTKTVRTQVYLLDGPPAPLPAGLVAFTPIYKVAYAPWSADGTVVVSLTLNPAVCDPAHAAELKIYSYNETYGWQAIPGQRFLAEGLSYSVLDPAIQTYAILGPAAYLKTKP